MFEALEAVAEDLSRRGVPHALIGAGAMAAHGVVRSTDDLDLLVTEREVLRPGYWAALEAAGYHVEQRPGDDTEPRAGVVRIARPPSRAVDLVVGRHPWQADAIRRARPVRIGRTAIGVATVADVILLKLFAGSAQDLLDARALLEAGDRRAIAADVERELARLPAEARAAWTGISGGA